MALTKQVIPAVLAKGIDTDTDPKVMSDGLLDCVNGHFDRRGAIIKRNGQSAIGAAASVGTSKWLGVHKDNPIVFGNGLYKYSGATAENGSFKQPARSNGLITDVDVDRYSIGTVTSGQFVEVAEKGNVRAIAMSRGTEGSTTWTTRVETYDIQSGVKLAESTFAEDTLSEGCGKFVATASTLRYYFLNSTAPNQGLYEATINTTTGAISASAQVVGAPQPSAFYHTLDAVYAGGDTVWVVYPDNTDSARYVHIESGGTGTVTAVDLITATTTCMGIFTVSDNAVATGDAVVICYNDITGGNNELHAVCLASDRTGIAADTVLRNANAGHNIYGFTGVETGGAATYETTVYVTEHDVNGGGKPQIMSGTYNTGGGSIGATPFIESAKVYCKPVRRTGSLHVLGVYKQTWQHGTPGLDETGTAILAEASDGATSVPATRTLTSASASFVTAGVKPGDYVRIIDTSSAGDDGHYIISNVAATVLTVGKDWPTGSLTTLHYVVMKAPPADDGVIFFVDETGNGVGQALRGTATFQTLSDPTTALQLQHAISPFPSGGKTLIGAAYKQRNTSKILRTSPAVLSLDLNPTPDRTYESQNTTIIANSLPYVVDSEGVSELGFLWAPTVRCTPRDNTAGPAAGTYRYIAIYERTDGEGNLVQSAPSLSTLITTATAQEILVEVDQYKQGDIPYVGDAEIVLYRTEDGGTVYYEVTRQTAGATFAVVDSTTDTDLVTKPQLYTQSGELGADPPHAMNVHCMHQGRHVYVERGRDNDRIRYSKLPQSGVGVEHSDFLTISAPEDAGDIIALASFLDKLIVFKKYAIHAIEGEGLNNLGQGTGYRRPYLVSSGVGCINKRSVIQIPQGIMFQSSDGIYILTTSMQVEPVGRRVKYFLSGTSVTATAVHPIKNLALFFLADNNILVYNYVFDEWTRWSNHNGTDAVYARDRYYFRSTTEDRMLVESTGFTDYLADTPTHVPLKITTGWFSFAGLGGYKRLYEVLLTAQNITDHDLTFKISYDFEGDSTVYGPTNTATDVNSFSDIDAYYTDDTADPAVDKGYMIKLYPGRQKCTAVRLYIEQTKATAAAQDTQGVSLTGLSFLVGMRSGLLRVGAARTIGD